MFPGTTELARRKETVRSVVVVVVVFGVFSACSQFSSPNPFEKQGKQR